MFVQEQLERAVGDMRAQFRTASGQIADELTRLAQHLMASPPAVRERVITAMAQIASTQQFLRAESERLPPDPQEAYAIMESVMQAQQGALHQLAIIVKQHAPGWYPSAASWQPAFGNAQQWPPALPAPAGWSSGQQQAAPASDQNTSVWPNVATMPIADDSTAVWAAQLAAMAGGDPHPQSATTYYPSPPTAQDLVTHGWPNANGGGNGYAVEVYRPQTSVQPMWPPLSNAQAVIPYVSGMLSEVPSQGPWPGRRSYSIFPPQPQYAPYGQYAHYPTPREVIQPRVQAASNGQMFANARRRAEQVAGGNTRPLYWLGIAAAVLIFAYLTFPWEIRRLDAVADQKVAMQEAEPPRLDPTARQRVMAAPQQPPPTLIVRAPIQEPPPPPPPSNYAPEQLPGGLMAGAPNVAIGIGWSQQPPAASPPIARQPAPIETASVPVEPTPAAARTKQRAASSRVEQEVAAAEAVARGERFVPVLFTHQDGQAVSQAFAELQQQYPQVLASRQGQIQPVDLGKKGIWHRLVVLPAGPRQDADNLCGALSGVGYEKCWVKPY